LQKFMDETGIPEPVEDLN